MDASEPVSLEELESELSSDSESSVSSEFNPYTHFKGMDYPQELQVIRTTKFSDNEAMSTLLYLCHKGGNLAGVRMLLKNYFNKLAPRINETGTHETPLNLAIMYRKHQMVDLLLELFPTQIDVMDLSAIVHRKDGSASVGFSAYHIATVYDDQYDPNVRVLTNKLANYDRRRCETLEQPIRDLEEIMRNARQPYIRPSRGSIVASKLDHSASSVFSEFNAYTHFKDMDYRQALHVIRTTKFSDKEAMSVFRYACYTGDDEFVQILYDRFSRYLTKHINDTVGETSPLTTAIMKSNISTVELLLELFPNIRIHDNPSITYERSGHLKDMPSSYDFAKLSRDPEVVDRVVPMLDNYDRKTSMGSMFRGGSKKRKTRRVKQKRTRRKYVRTFR